MNATTIPRYLIGSRRAILEIAASRWSLLIGAVLVFSGGLARKYDAQDLLHEPWHPFRSYAASLVFGSILFITIELATRLNKNKAPSDPPPLHKSWLTFMSLFWMAAPMAWLYAIPYERFMSATDAITANVWTLALVSAWRVGLMTRVINVIYGIGPVASFFLVMVFADAITFIVISNAPTPVISIMGGIQHTPEDELVRDVTLTVQIITLLTFPVWAIGALASRRVIKPRWADRAETPRRFPLAPMLTAAAAIAAFMALLLATQPEQIRRHRAEQLLTTGRIPEALAFMSDHPQHAFPPRWNPPPKLGYREDTPDLTAVRDAMRNQWPADWVAEIFIGKLSRQYVSRYAYAFYDQDWPTVAQLIESQEFHSTTDPDEAITLRLILDHDQTLTEADRAAIEKIEQLISETTEPDQPPVP